MDVEDQVARIVAAVKSRREALALELVLALHDTDPASLLRCDDALGHPLLMWCAVSGLSGLTEYLLSLAEGDGAANLVDRPASCACGHAGQNALMWAATTAFSPYAMKCAVILLRFGASPARQDAHGCTPITHAAQVGNLPMMHLLASISPGTADLLDFQGRSPLHWAAYSGHAGVVAYCIRVLGMNGNLNDAKLFSPLGRALQNNQPVVVHLLCELGVNMEAGFDISTRSTRGTSKWPRGAAQRAFTAHVSQSLLYAPPLRLARNKRDTLERIALAWVYPSIHLLIIAAAWMCGLFANGSGALLWVRTSTMFWSTSCMLLFFLCVRADPGYFSQRTVDCFESDIITWLHQHGIDYDEIAGHWTSVDGIISDSQDTNETALREQFYCFSCFMTKTPRSKHCTICRRCVDTFDHHCPWISNCTGRRNIIYLRLWLLALLFLLSTLFVSFLGLAFHIEFLLGLCWSPTFIASELLVSSSDTVNLYRRVVAGASAAVLLGFAVFVAFVARAQVEAMCSERTLNELLRVRREDFAE